jgi:hypothetical protein
MNASIDYAARSLLNTGSLSVESSHRDTDSERGEQAFRRLVGSLKKRWHYYCLLTLLAIGVGYAAASEYGSYSYKASSLVRTKSLPFPPGQAYYTPPRIEDFVKYLAEPEVTEGLKKDFALAGPPDKLFEQQFDPRTEVVTVQMMADRAEEAAERVNQLVARAIDKSTEERKVMLAVSLNYFQRLVAGAEDEASSQRHAKLEKLNSLRSGFAADGSVQLQFEELTEIVSLRRTELSTLESELKDSQRLLQILEDDERALVAKIHDELTADCLSQIELMAQPFAPDSPQAEDWERKAEAVKSLAETVLKNRNELSDWLRSVAVAAKMQLTIPPDYQTALERIAENLYELRNRLLLLPEKIEETTRALADATRRRAQLELSDEFDFENTPEIQELTILIARAEQNAEQIAAAIAWIEDLQTLDTPAFEQLVPASAENALPDGNHHKLFVLAFGMTGLLLGFPFLALDLLFAPTTAAQKLGNELGLATIPTHEIVARGRGNSALEVGDPELRLLALRIQQMAREARGSVVLFSSLADHISTKELTTTLAQCLAARREKVLIIDLEPIGENRLHGAAATRLDAAPKSKRRLLVAAPMNHPVNGDTPSTRPADIINGDGHALGHRKMGLAAALAESGKVPEDVLIEHGDDGVDRVQLGSGDLPLEAFATPLMGQLLDSYRKAYSMVLLSGPAAKHLADVQMLAARCDGTLFVAPEKGPVAQTARRTVVELMENRRVILGVAEVPG